LKRKKKEKGGAFESQSRTTSGLAENGKKLQPKKSGFKKSPPKNKKISFPKGFLGGEGKWQGRVFRGIGSVRCGKKVRGPPTKRLKQGKDRTLGLPNANGGGSEIVGSDVASNT